MCKVFRVFFIFLFCLFLYGLAGAQDVRVAWVPDGDTVILDNREVVRLKGIDAPETGFDGGQDQYFAREATQRLEDLVMGRTITMRTGQEPRDRFGRTLAYLYLPDGQNINLLLIRDGYAFYYPHEQQDEEISSRLLRAQRQAMEQNLGFWPEIFTLDELDLNFVGNRRSQRFHVATCGYGQRISPQNRIEFSSIYDAFYAGHAPCRRCSPWPDAR
ncbi:thermonuclease family protein [Desulfonatronovibrio magnus]|uniref:thermonuclease family protein n=1 Tax=Desulfonatronovibrio magnus TaxID=698827 RepID=UPI00069771AB|nr:thermonuclease family protein [Desulfonatronovibrio magnus]RQD68111.1 MAG: hypothetical protein D5R98_00260 [Desulfonatronovibrio sp. MSAO_Bac4]